MSESARNDKRVRSAHPLMVRCESWGDFVQMYAGDISQGGLFIVTETLPEILSYIEVRMKLPEGHDVVLKGRVVHVLTPEMAEAEGSKPGVGVEFQELDGPIKDQIHQLVEYARRDGSQDNSVATYASSMFESSQQKSAADLMASIPAPEAPRTSSARPVDPARRVERKRNVRTTGRARKIRRKHNTSDASGAGKLPVRPEGMSMVGKLPEVDPARIKEAMTHIAHKRFAEAVKTLTDVIKVAPNSKEAKKWLYLAQARDQMVNGKAKRAMAFYQQVLDEVEEDNHEAREAVRKYHRDRKLKAIPFGRLFLRDK